MTLMRLPYLRGIKSRKAKSQCGQDEQREGRRTEEPPENHYSHRTFDFLPRYMRTHRQPPVPM